MCGLRTVRASILALAALGGPCTASPVTDLARDFADCAGRYAALAEHQWMFDGPASDQSLRRRDIFADLVQAVLPDLPPEVAPALFDRRVAARAAQRGLLDAARFGRQAGHRAQAAARATAYIRACDRLAAGT
jgi:hypothetical protein